MDNSNKLWSISDNEIAYYISPRSNGNVSSLRLYIPVLMPLISKGSPKQTPVSLNKSCIVNATECKPTISSTIRTQNYKTVPRIATQYFGNTSTLRWLHYNDKLQLEIHHNDVDNIYVTNKLDPSISPYYED